MAKDAQLNILEQGIEVWNEWRKNNPDTEIDLSGADFRRKDLTGINFRGAGSFHTVSESEYGDPPLGIFVSSVDLSGANFREARLSGVDFSEVDIKEAKFVGANLYRANFTGANVRTSDFNRANLFRANFTDANVKTSDFTGANLMSTNFGEADISWSKFNDALLNSSDFSGANLMSANVSGADLCGANFSKANVSHLRYDRKKMRGKYLGIRGIESCYGSALFRRDALDQDFLDSTEERLRVTRWGKMRFWAWGLIDYGRSIWGVAVLGLGLALLFGSIYLLFPAVIGQCNVKFAIGQGYISYIDRCWHGDWFTPFYFSLVTYTTLGFGDITPKGHPIGEIIVSAEVIMGYVTLGLLLAVLTEKLARRS